MSLLQIVGASLEPGRLVAVPVRLYAGRPVPLIGAAPVTCRCANPAHAPGVGAVVYAEPSGDDEYVFAIE